MRARERCTTQAPPIVLTMSHNHHLGALVDCPECGLPAEVEWSSGAPGAASLIKIRCVQRHWFLLPSERVEP